MKIVNLTLAVKDEFEIGDCDSCPLYKEDSKKCFLNYRHTECPLRFPIESWSWEEEITD